VPGGATALNETCDKKLAGARPCHLPAGHEGECDHNDEHSGATPTEDAHEQEGEWLDDFVHDHDDQA
jgi:hypothetical protein